MADGGFFPEREVVCVSLAVAAECCGLDAMGVTCVEFGIDKIIVA